MNLLPREHADFRTKAYWNKFFKARGSSPFEWYGEFPDLCSVIHKYIKCSDKVLMVGCGNSQLSADMYDIGYKNITNIDISEFVIRQMIRKNQTDRPTMTFLKMDVMNMDFDDGEFTAVFDKGTLDAIMIDDSEEVMSDVNKMFSEISRTMRLGGRYVIISLLQKHILQKILAFFTEMGYPVRIHHIDITNNPDVKKEFCMPVFAVIVTKFKKIAGMKQIYEVMRHNDNMERMECPEKMVTAVSELQYFAMMRQHLNKNSVCDEQVRLELFNGSSHIPRYILHVVDSPKPRPNKFAIFIVPMRRETEWLFAMEVGRKQLLENADVERLIVVIVQRGHEYGDMDSIQDELNEHMLELAPASYKPGTKIPFLSLGEDLSKVEVLEEGTSDLTGDYVIEDLEGTDGNFYRRLIFLNNQNLIQSEARLLEPESKKKRGKKYVRNKMIVDKSYLACKHHLSIVAGLVLLNDCCKLLDTGFKILLVGLGGGSLATFIHKHFPKVSLDVVDIDVNMVKVASKWFSFEEDDRMKAHVAEGISFIRERAENDAANKYHVIILDVDDKDYYDQICPPKPFVETENLENMKRILSPQGVLIVNLLCRNEKRYAEALANIKNIYQSLYRTSIEEEVNDTVYAFPIPQKIESWKSKEIPADIFQRMTVMNDSIKMQSQTADIDLAESLAELVLS